jgi:Flp pilus assembly protein TadG
VTQRTERGAASAELVIATPLLLLMLMAIVQFALWQHAGHVAEAAAQEGVRAARLDGGSTAEGRTVAESFLMQSAPNLIESRGVDVSRSGDVVRVEVSGSTRGVLPGIAMPVRGISEGPVERFEAGG